MALPDQHVKYNKGDIRRLLRVAYALGTLPSPSINALARETGHNKQTVIDDIKRLQEQLRMNIEKVESDYIIRDWGPLLTKEGIWELLSRR